MKITIETLVHTDRATAWTAYNTAQDIVQWNTPSPDWHTTRSDNDLREGGAFSTRMEAKDGSVGFDFAGTYTRVVPDAVVEYRIGDGREVQVTFDDTDDGTRVRVVFDAETENDPEFQRLGWQAILDSFGRYAEKKARTA